MSTVVDLMMSFPVGDAAMPYLRAQVSHTYVYLMHSIMNGSYLKNQYHTSIMYQWTIFMTAPSWAHTGGGAWPPKYTSLPKKFARFEQPYSYLFNKCIFKYYSTIIEKVSKFQVCYWYHNIVGIFWQGKFSFFLFKNES